MLSTWIKYRTDVETCNTMSALFINKKSKTAFPLSDWNKIYMKNCWFD